LQRTPLPPAARELPNETSVEFHAPAESLSPPLEFPRRHLLSSKPQSRAANRHHQAPRAPPEPSPDRSLVRSPTRPRATIPTPREAGATKSKPVWKAEKSDDAEFLPRRKR